VREHWTLDPYLRYLNHGSFGAVPRVTQQTQRRLQEAAEANPMRWFRDLSGRLEATRDLVGSYLGVAGHNIALVPNATSGVAIALRSVPITPGQRLVVTDHGYGGVAFMVRRVAAERGGEVVVVPVELDATDDEVVSALAEVVDARSACIVIDQITSSTAKLMPAARIAELGRDRGVPTIVDGAHAPALIDEPVVGDYWTGNLHKWPCAPRGTGVLYVTPARQQSVAHAVASWDDPLGFPRSFDRPGTMDATSWLAAPSSLALMATLGFVDHRKGLGELVQAGAEQLAAAIGEAVVDVGSAAPTMRLVSLPHGMVTDEPSGQRLGAYLAGRSGTEVAITSWRGRGFVRLSAHLYNTTDDYTGAASKLAPLLADPHLRAGLARSAW
jgi:isopenicillin-N epimerase